jgi:hypothetical protein
MDLQGLVRIYNKLQGFARNCKDLQGFARIRKGGGHGPYAGAREAYAGPTRRFFIFVAKGGGNNLKGFGKISKDLQRCGRICNDL